MLSTNHISKPVCVRRVILADLYQTLISDFSYSSRAGDSEKKLQTKLCETNKKKKYFGIYSVVEFGNKMNNINEEKTKKTVKHARREPTSGPLAHTRTLAKNVFVHTHTEAKTSQMCSHASLSSKNRPACLDLALEQFHPLALYHHTSHSFI